MMMGVETWLLLATLVLLAWMYSKWRHSYWSSNGTPSPPAVPLLGHYHKEYFIDPKCVEFYQANYTKYYESKRCGLYDFFHPVLVIWDPELIKHIFIKDFDHFTDIRDFDTRTGVKRDEMVSNMLTSKTGEDWKNLRSVMTPTFSSGKIKSMFPLVCEKSDILAKFMVEEANKNPIMELKEVFGHFTMDTIASCAFGIECNSLINKNSDFARRADSFFQFGPMALFKITLYQFIPSLFRALRIPINPVDIDYFIYMVEETIAARQTGHKRGDFLDLLLEAREQSNNKLVLNDLTMVAQCVLFIVAGYETTSTLLTFTSFMLAKHKDQQERLRNEVKQIVAEHNGITYQGINDSKLLEAVLQETLRLYSPALITERKCTKTYKVPGTDIILKPGYLVQVPIWCLHHDSNLWPQPNEFIPDRFLPENKSNITFASHMPFGLGPRNCIANRFALLEVKVALSKLLLEVEMEIPPGHQELDLYSASGILRSKNGVKMTIKPIKE